MQWAVHAWPLALLFAATACNSPLRTPIDDSGPGDAMSPTGGRAISAGYYGTCATRGPDVLCWGGFYGTTDPPGEDCNGAPCFRSPQVIPAVQDPIALVGGGGFSCALLVDGSARCWGQNPWGQLGNGATTSLPDIVEPMPQRVPLDGVRILAAGNAHTCAGTSDAVYCWGQNQYGQLGNDLGGGLSDMELAPTAVAGLGRVDALDGGERHTCATSGGNVFCWGSNQYGQLGASSVADSCGQPPEQCSLAPVQVDGITDATELEAGTFHTCVLHRGGQVTCWGRNDQGQVGGAALSDRVAPTLDSSLANVTSLSAGNFHNCGLTADAGVVCWGSHRGYRMGSGDAALQDCGGTACALAPIAPLALGGVQDVSAGLDHTCALLTGGEIWCWGLDLLGQLGVGPDPAPEICSGTRDHPCSRTPIRVMGF